MFDTFTAAPFTTAGFQLLYDSSVGRAVRAALLLAGAGYVFTSAGNFSDPSRVNVNLASYLWGLFLFWEVFYFFKVRSLNVGEEVGKNSNFAASFSTSAAKILLKSGSKDLGIIFNEAIKTPFAKFVLAKSGLTEKDVKKENTWGSFEDYLAALQRLSVEENRQFVTKSDLFSALAMVPGPFKQALFDKELKEEDLVNILFWAAAEENAGQKRLQFWNNQSLVASKGIAHDWAYGYTLSLNRYARDITSDLTTGKITPYLIGRDEEIDAVQKILSRSLEKNVLLVGEAGVGKSTVVQAIAKRSLNGETMPQLRYKRFLQLDLTSLLSTSGEGEIEQRVKDLLGDAERAGNIILVIPDIEYLAGAGEGITKADLTGLFIGSLQGSQLQLIALVDHPGYKKYLGNHKSFLENFEQVEIRESSAKDTIRVLEKMAPELERRHHINLTYGALKSTVELSGRYMPERQLPGKAIQLLDEASVEASAAGKTDLSGSDIASIITRKTRIPVGKATGPEKEKLLNLEGFLHQRIIGQDEAITAVSNALRRARAGLRDPAKPIGVYLFLGPTGVGKTETAKSLAEAYFGAEKNMIRLDMSEYQTVQDQAKLLGQSGEGGNLTEAVRQAPFSLILLDEIEKAHPKILDTFLQVFDDGRLTDGAGRVVDFTNTVIIATSNAGAETIRQLIITGKNLATEKAGILDDLQQQGVFKPELLNRFDEAVLFRPLTIEEIVKVVQIMLRGLDKRLATQDIIFEITDAAVKKIAAAGYDPVFGARPLRRYIQDQVEGVLAKKLLDGSIKRGDTITLDVDDVGDISTEVFK